ncbi:ornithine carbamoyltransferase [Streptomyces mashuensis]|uniref:Ornithine carbamoyltransferase n=1 Tax=Streptomyces mashuensis TaxID=33904 RepID=A0A919B9J9_9ACTN|nr:ornithine carbamoyltransferase [Streptomyces mashuensis]GHF69369.1 ornithine carbamoyltransferase [Streptomyces mashuensis]
MRSLLSLADIDDRTLAALVDRAVVLGRTPQPEQTLAGKSVGIYFRRSSTRTRTAFWSAAVRLGAHAISYGPDDLQLVTGESLEDTGRVLGNYLDILVARTNDDMAELRGLARSGELSIVNALTAYEHPTQALADLAMLTEEFGSLDGRELLYVGEGNSTAAALALATAHVPGFRLTVVTPPGYGMPDEVLPLVEEIGGSTHGVTQTHDLASVDRTVDAVYTARWQTMGVQHADQEWMKAFLPYQVTTGLLDRLSKDDTIFMHDLPAMRGEEVVDEVLDGPRSRAWRQAYHKMTAAMAVLEWCAAA